MLQHQYKLTRLACVHYQLTRYITAMDDPSVRYGTVIDVGLSSLIDPNAIFCSPLQVAPVVHTTRTTLTISANGVTVCLSVCPS